MLRFHWKLCKTIIPVVLIGLTVSCAPFSFVAGDYLSKIDTYARFSFLQDSTFYYRYEKPYEDLEISSGKYQIVGKNIYLNSYGKRNSLKLHYTVKICCELFQNILIINVSYDVKDNKGYYCIPYINGEDSGAFPIYGAFQFKSVIPIHSICFKVGKRNDLQKTYVSHSIFTDTIYPIANMGDTLDIHIVPVDSLFTYKVFNNVPLHIKSLSKSSTE